MREYKLIGTDMDGTLLNKKSMLSDENRDAIAKLTGKGVNFVTITGRSFSEIPAEITGNSNIRFIACSNGAHIIDKLTGKHTLTCIPNDVKNNAMDIINEYDTCVMIHHNGQTLADAERADVENYKYFRTPARYKDFIDAYGKYIPDYKETCYALENIEMISMFFRHENELEECRERLKACGEFIVAAAFAHSLEIISKNAGKGNGLRKIAAILDVDIQDTIGVGDSANDTTLLQAAGLALAVDNAWDELKAIADDVICNNEEHIAVYILNNYIDRAEE